MKLSRRPAAPSSTAMCGIVVVTCSCFVAVQAQQLDDDPLAFQQTRDIGDQMPPASFDAADGGAEAFPKLEGNTPF